MKGVYVIFFCLIVHSALLNAQYSNIIDSLKIVLERSDEIRKIDILNQLSELYERSAPFKSYKYAKDALRLSTLKNHPSGQMLAHRYIDVFFKGKPTG